MAHAQHYEAILETYRKQQSYFEESDQNFEKEKLEYYNAMKQLEQIKKETWDAESNLFEKKNTLLGTMKRVFNTCDQNDLTVCELRNQTGKFHDLEKENKKLENYIRIYERLSKDLNQMGLQAQPEKLRTNIDKYQEKTADTMKTITDLNQKYRAIVDSKTNISLPGYDVYNNMNARNWKTNNAKSFYEIKNELKKIKSNLENIKKKTEEFKKNC